MNVVSVDAEEAAPVAVAGEGAVAPAAEAAAPVAVAGEGAVAPAAEPAALVPAAEAGAPVHDGEAAQESVQHMYEVALAKLDALHDGWTAAMGELRELLVDVGSGEAAA
jgi:hypothetical protein